MRTEEEEGTPQQDPVVPSGCESCMFHGHGEEGDTENARVLFMGNLASSPSCSWGGLT